MEADDLPPPESPGESDVSLGGFDPEESISSEEDPRKDDARLFTSLMDFVLEGDDEPLPSEDEVAEAQHTVRETSRWAHRTLARSVGAITRASEELGPNPPASKGPGEMHTALLMASGFKLTKKSETPASHVVGGLVQLNNSLRELTAEFVEEDLDHDQTPDALDRLRAAAKVWVRDVYSYAMEVVLEHQNDQPQGEPGELRQIKYLWGQVHRLLKQVADTWGFKHQQAVLAGAANVTGLLPMLRMMLLGNPAYHAQVTSYFTGRRMPRRLRKKMKQ